MKNVIELQEKLIEVFARKFHEQYPEIFIKPNTTDEYIHATTCEGYDLYMAYLNSIPKFCGLPMYKVDSIDFHDGTHEGEKLIKHMNETKDILRFCFFNFPLNYH